MFTKALLQSCGSSTFSATNGITTTNILSKFISPPYPTEKELYEEREQKLHSSTGRFDTNTFWGPSRCSKCKMLVRFLSTACMSCGYRMKMNAASGRALEGT